MNMLGNGIKSKQKKYGGTRKTMYLTEDLGLTAKGSLSNKDTSHFF